MNTIPLLEDVPWGTGDHPDAGKPLSAFRQITAICNDCGNAKTFDEAALRDLSAVPSLGFLAKHARCTPCKEAGATGRANLEFQCEPLEQKPAKAVNWSRAPVFTEDRADPTPNLPRRNIFDRRIPQRERMR